MAIEMIEKICGRLCTFDKAVWKYMLKVSALGSAALSDVFNIKHHRQSVKLALKVPHNIRTREHLYVYTLSKTVF